jgi:guanylate kinase
MGKITDIINTFKNEFLEKLKSNLTGTTRSKRNRERSGGGWVCVLD